MSEVNEQSFLMKVSNFFFGTMGVVFTVASFGMLIEGLCSFFYCVFSGCDRLNALLDMSSHLIIAVAIFDVGRYLLEEEVFRDRELRSPKEARQSLTKFMVIIVIAVTLESLIGVIKASSSSLDNLIYPTILFFVASILLVGLGLYQKLSVMAEIDVKNLEE